MEYDQVPSAHSIARCEKYISNDKSPRLVLYMEDKDPRGIKYNKITFNSSSLFGKNLLHGMSACRYELHKKLFFYKGLHKSG